jgi:hypothetical protein
MRQFVPRYPPPWSPAQERVGIFKRVPSHSLASFFFDPVRVCDPIESYTAEVASTPHRHIFTATCSLPLPGVICLDIHESVLYNVAL